MKQFFITGTDTHVGKTTAAAILTYALRACYWKPIQAGLDSIDKNTVKQLTGFDESYFFDSSYQLKASLSPHQAAHQENITIDLKQCQLPSTSKPLIVEGAGGVFVPLNESNTLLDLMKNLNLPVIVVTRGTLGTINHTLMTLDVLKRHGLTVQGVIFCGELNPDNQLTIEQWGKIKTLFHIPYFQSLNPLTLQQWVTSNRSFIEDSVT